MPSTPSWTSGSASSARISAPPSPLTDALQSDIAQHLSRITGKQIRSHFTVDPELIGGLVARVGSTVYDGSVRGQLAQLAKRFTV